MSRKISCKIVADGVRGLSVKVAERKNVALVTGQGVARRRQPATVLCSDVVRLSNIATNTEVDAARYMPIKMREAVSFCVFSGLIPTCLCSASNAKMQDASVDHEVVTKLKIKTAEQRITKWRSVVERYRTTRVHLSENSFFFISLCPQLIPTILCRHELLILTALRLICDVRAKQAICLEMSSF